MAKVKVWLGPLLCGMPLLLLACASIARSEPQVVIGRISLSDRAADEVTIGVGSSEYRVYEVRPNDGPETPILLIAYALCPFDLDHPERNDPDQLYRIEYVSAPGFEIWDSSRSNLVTTRCEKV